MRVGTPHNEKPAVLVDETTAVDVSSVVDDFDPGFFARGGASVLRGHDLSGLPRLSLDDVRIGPPVARPSKVVCIGLNYRTHAIESNMDIPDEPIVFFKAPSSLCGPDDPVPMPPGATKLDWEVELAIVIGREARYLRDERDSASRIAGFTISNDVSERAFQLERGGQWVKGKSAENFNPLGPWVATTDELPDGPQALDLRLAVNDEQKQSSNTSDMIFGVDHIIWYLSQFMVLDPGDVINTGTPSGVALGDADPAWLHVGDTMQLSIDHLGSQRQRVVSANLHHET